MDQHDPNNKVKIYPDKQPGLDKKLAKLSVSEEQIKSVFIVEGISAKEIADRYFLEEKKVLKIIKDNKLEELRNAHIRQGIEKLQNIQVQQAERLLDLETNFKKMRILQLEEVAKEFMTYYSRYGHFYKVHPTTGEILRDTNGMAIQVKIPNIAKELEDLKASVTLSEGLKQLLSQLDALINKPADAEKIGAGDTIDMDEFGGMFTANKREEPEEDDE